MESCEECGRTIGNLETPHIHEERVVCDQRVGQAIACRGCRALLGRQ